MIQPDGTFSTSYDTHALGASGTPYTITYAFAGDTNFKPASNGTSTLTVNKANQSIQWSNPADIGYGTALSATQLNATVTGVPGGSAPGALTYALADDGTILNAGTIQLMVTAAGTANYNAATLTVYINVLTASQQANTLTQEVNALVPVPLSTGQAKVLKSLLTLTAYKTVNIVKVNGFIASVVGLQRTGILTQAQANPLIQGADSLLATLKLG